METYLPEKGIPNSDNLTLRWNRRLSVGIEFILLYSDICRGKPRPYPDRMGSTMTRGQRVGYIRVSTADQNTARQLDGVDLDRIFEDKASGKDAKRPKLQELLAYVREGDTVIVHSMDRLARNVDDLRRIVTELSGRGVRVEFQREGVIFTGEDNPMNTLLLTMLGAVAEFLRAQNLENQREGIAKARQAGKYKGRKRAFTPEQVAEIRQRVAAGEKKTALAKELGVNRDTLYEALKGYRKPKTI